MLKPINHTIQTYEDSWNGVIYEYSDLKNPLTSMNHQELLGLTQLRLKYCNFFVSLAEHSLDYEPIKDIYKKKLTLFKQSDESTTVPMLQEVQVLFDLCKDKYLQVFCTSLSVQLQKYRQVRNTVLQSLDGKDDNKWKVASGKQAREQLEAMRKEFQVTKDHIPNQLREAFDIFVEVHSKKGFLVTRKLVSEE